VQQSNYIRRKEARQNPVAAVPIAKFSKLSAKLPALRKGKTAILDRPDLAGSGLPEIADFARGIASAMTNSLAAELELLAHHMLSEKSGNQQLSLPALSERIAKDLQVSPDEVAILAISEKSKSLNFLVPEALRNVGSIPLSSTSALAARTARESRPDIQNNFSTVRHVTVFEGVKADTLRASAIQKIISAPILFEGKVIGVIQISRKASSAAEAGPDFTPDDLGRVLAICKPLGKLIRHAAGS
jgi:hypothetical protein